MRKSTQAEYARRVLLAQQTLEAHLDNDDAVSPRRLAKVAGMAPHHFHRVFRAMTGESVMQQQRRLRLERAARRLRAQPAMEILPVAMEAGYGSHEAFTRAFQQAFGAAPSAFRTQPTSTEVRRACAPLDFGALDVELRRLQERPWVGMRGTGPFTDVPALWEQLHGWRAEHSALVANAHPPMAGLVHDDPTVTDEDKLRYDAVLLLPEGAPLGEVPAPAVSGTLPGGLYAVLTHVGSYWELHESYLALIGGWFPHSGHVLAAAPTVERYLNSPHDTPEPELRTELWVRVEEAGWVTAA